MEIRNAQPRDIPELIRLLRQVGQVHREIRPDLFRRDAQKYTPAELEALLADPDRPIFVAAGGEALLGYAFCIVQRTADDTVLRDRTELYLDDLCVDSKCRSQGIGRALFDRVRAFAQSAGCRGLTLNVWCGNESAMAFYEKCGLTPRKIVMETSLEDT